jgi:EmrB/QacA subfamily drug resistance transporter
MNVDVSSVSKTTIETIDSTHTSPWKKWGSLVVLSLALAIIIIDTTLLNVSLKTIIQDLHTDIHSMQWVITAYSLMLAAFTITGGRLGDFFGRKKMFIWGAVIFAIGSFLASISTNVGVLILGESIIEGIGAALMMPATASLLVTTFQGRERAIAFGIWGGIAAASSAVGPILGGWLTTNYSWRWGFRINIVVVALLLLGSLLVKESRDREEKPEIDYFGVFLSALGLLSLVFGFIKASDYGWLKAKEQLVLWGHSLNLGSLSVTPIFIIVGLLILTFFAIWEHKRELMGRTPLVSLKIFKNREFTTGSMVTLILSLAMSGLFFAIPVFLQAVRNLDAFHTGTAMFPLSLSLLIAAPLSAFLVKYIAPNRLIQIGLVIATISFWVLRAGLSVDATAKDLILGMSLFGVGMGIMMAQLSNLTLSAVSVEQAGEASGVNNTLRQLGQTLGSAILGAILISSLSTNLSAGVMKSSVIPEPIKPSLAQLVSSQASGIEFGASGALPINASEEITTEIFHIGQQATVDANRTTLVYGSIFMFLGLLVSFFLPSKKNNLIITGEHNSMSETIKHEDNHNVTTKTVVTEEVHSSAHPTHHEVVVGPDRSALSRVIGIILGLILLAGLVALIWRFTHPKETTPEPTPPTVTVNEPVPVQPTLPTPVDTNPPLIAGVETGQPINYEAPTTGAASNAIALAGAAVTGGAIYFIRRRKLSIQS